MRPDPKAIRRVQRCQPFRSRKNRKSTLAFCAPHCRLCIARSRWRRGLAALFGRFLLDFGPLARAAFFLGRVFLGWFFSGAGDPSARPDNPVETGSSATGRVGRSPGRAGREGHRADGPSHSLTGSSRRIETRDVVPGSRLRRAPGRRGEMPADTPDRRVPPRKQSPRQAGSQDGVGLFVRSTGVPEASGRQQVGRARLGVEARAASAPTTRTRAAWSQVPAMRRPSRCRWSSRYSRPPAAPVRSPACARQGVDVVLARTVQDGQQLERDRVAREGRGQRAGLSLRHGSPLCGQRRTILERAWLAIG